MSSSGYILNFVDEGTGESIVTVSGKMATWLMKHSELIQSLREINQNRTHFTIPISFPHGRVEIFKKLMKGIPVGQYIIQDGQKYVQYDPVSEEEEAMIAKNIREGKIHTSVQYERANAVWLVLTYLMIDPAHDLELVKIRDLSNANQELVRRAKIFRTRKNKMREHLRPVQLLGPNVAPLVVNEANLNRRAQQQTIPYLDEDTIENLVEKHKDLIFGAYASKYYSQIRMQRLMNQANIDKRQKVINALKQKATRNLVRQSGLSKEEAERAVFFHDMPKIFKQSPYNVEALLQKDLAPFRKYNLARTKSQNFERYLRSKRKKGEEKYLPYQGKLVGNLFGDSNNLQ